MTRFASYGYQPGGSLPPDAPTYVTRQADQELLDALLEGTYCYVLNSRQMGKSSLRVRTMERLADRGILSIEIELLGIGSQRITASQWYGGIIAELNSGLNLRVNRREWLQAHDDLSPVQRLSTFVEQVVLAKVTQPLVIFFDEIDSVLGLSFPTDDFFGLVRSWYERRSRQPRYRQLTVVMLGVATPSDLIQDETSTPFNIGRAIELRGFHPVESSPLAAGLAPYADRPDAVIQAILDWTGGQPFLTQKLCWLVTRQAQPVAAGEEVQQVRQLVRSHLIDNWETQDQPEHLRTIRDRLLRQSSQPERLLRRYRTILRRGSISATNTPELMELRLTGLVTQQQGRLVPFNRVYATVFDQAWVAQQLRALRRQGRPLPGIPLWQTAAVGLGSALVVLGVRSLGLLQGLELQTFDQMMRWQPMRAADDRFLIITVSEADIQYQDQLGMERIGSLSDEALLQLWDRLMPHAPRVIGLDFYHDFPFLPELAARLRQSRNFVLVCGIGQTIDVETPVSIPAPPELPTATLGFTDVAIDADYRVRRQLLGMDRSETCPTSRSFNLQVALKYLASEGIALEFLDEDHIQLGNTIIPKLPPTAGGYRLSSSEQAGFQTLVNYRAADPPRVSLRQILQGDLDGDLAELVGDRIVLIGLEDPKDALFIPGRSQRMLGVVMHAHMASQLIDAALGDRPLLWWWPDWLEALWVVGWGMVGSGIICRQVKGRSPWPILVLIILVPVGIGYGMLAVNSWVPVIPGMMAIALAAGTTCLLVTKN
ncbi:MAG: CHASE2 domain-containing protein [Synechococcales bacterium]|nr:CHASE2 domain-containing protein [Synechococcales bacterium]